MAGTERIGNEAPVRIFSGMDSLPKTGSPKKPAPTKVDTLRYRKQYFKKFSSYHLRHNDNLLKKRRKRGLVLRLRDLVYDRTEVYALIEIRNRSGIDFEVELPQSF